MNQWKPDLQDADSFNCPIIIPHDFNDPDFPLRDDSGFVTVLMNHPALLAGMGCMPAILIAMAVAPGFGTLLMRIEAASLLALFCCDLGSWLDARRGALARFWSGVLLAVAVGLAACIPTWSAVWLIQSRS